MFTDFKGLNLLLFTCLDRNFVVPQSNDFVAVVLLALPACASAQRRLLRRKKP